MADPLEEKDIFSERPEEAAKMKKQIEDFLASVERSQAGADYPEGKVTKSGPHGRFWYAIEEYQPYLAEWESRPEYKSWVNRGKEKDKPKGGKKKGEAKK